MSRGIQNGFPLTTSEFGATAGRRAAPRRRPARRGTSLPVPGGCRPTRRAGASGPVAAQRPTRRRPAAARVGPGRGRRIRVDHLGHPGPAPRPHHEQERPRPPLARLVGERLRVEAEVRVALGEDRRSLLQDDRVPPAAEQRPRALRCSSCPASVTALGAIVRYSIFCLYAFAIAATNAGRSFVDVWLFPMKSTRSGLGAVGVFAARARPETSASASTATSASNRGVSGGPPWKDRTNSTATGWAVLPRVFTSNPSRRPLYEWPVCPRTPGCWNMTVFPLRSRSRSPDVLHIRSADDSVEALGRRVRRSRKASTRGGTDRRRATRGEAIIEVFSTPTFAPADAFERSRSACEFCGPDRRLRLVRRRSRASEHRFAAFATSCTVVHEHAARPGGEFWAGLGAVRREASSASVGSIPSGPDRVDRGHRARHASGARRLTRLDHPRSVTRPEADRYTVEHGGSEPDFFTLRVTWASLLLTRAIGPTGPRPGWLDGASAARARHGVRGGGARAGDRLAFWSAAAIVRRPTARF